MKTKLFLIYILFFSVTYSVSAQKHEIGASLGGLNYKGELAPDFDLRVYRPALYGFYKNNFNPAFALKISLLGGKFYASDTYNADPLPLARNRETNTLIVELAAMGEYNFFDFRKGGDRRRFSPYLTGGLGFFTYSRDQVQIKEVSDGAGIAIPFGVGIKYQLSRQLNLGFEFVARKTFTDYLDGLSARTLDNGLQIGDPHGQDWYYFTGFTFSYTFYGVKCPESFR